MFTMFSTSSLKDGRPQLLFCLLVDNIPFPTPIFFCGRCALDAEIMKYVNEAYQKGICSVCCVIGKDVEEPGPDFELVVVISAARHSPQNFWCVKLTFLPSFLPYSCCFLIFNRNYFTCYPYVKMLEVLPRVIVHDLLFFWVN